MSILIIKKNIIFQIFYFNLVNQILCTIKFVIKLNVHVFVLNGISKLRIAT